MANVGPRDVDFGSLEGLAASVKKGFLQLQTALTSLDLKHNFKGKDVTVTFTGTSEIAIRNPFRDGTIPTRWVVVDVQSGGTFTPQRGTTAWTIDFVYLKNTSGGTVVSKIIFYR